LNGKMRAGCHFIRAAGLISSRLCPQRMKVWENLQFTGVIKGG
jgi:hypothetical protein